MPLKIKNLPDNHVELQFENVITIWNILKFITDTPYLKHFIISGYDGGNTLAPRETWHEEGVMYKEISKDTFLFPYDSIGFIVDDSIHNISFYCIESYTPGMDFQNNNEMALFIKNTDEALLIVSADKVPTVFSLYLLSTMKVGFDRQMLKAMDEIMDEIIEPNLNEVEYIQASLTFGVKGLSFLTGLKYGDAPASLYKISYINRKAKKELTKDNTVRNFGLFKKKILSQNKYFPLLYSLFFIFAGVAIFFINKKLLISLAVIYLISGIVYSFIKKNAHKLLSGSDKKTKI